MSVVVKVIKGRETFEINCGPKTTFGELRSEVETKSGAVKDGLRLLHKGKSFPDEASLESAKVSNGTRMMAIVTAKQREADTKREKEAKSAQDSAALDAMRERSGKKEKTTPASLAVIRGDPAIEGQTSVILVKGREKFRSNISLSSTVEELKVTASNLEGINATARDMKLLFKGKFLNDMSTLSSCGIGDRASVMMLFSARHHDAQDARTELDQIDKEWLEFEQKARSVLAKAKSRLLEGVDLALAKNEVFDTFTRLEDNLQSVRGEEERREASLDRLRRFKNTLEELRKFT